MDYAAPSDHLGVSGFHLEITEITETGAWVVNHAYLKNGTLLNGEDQGARFFWSFGSEALLAQRWTKSPVVRLSLRKI